MKSHKILKAGVSILAVATFCGTGLAAAQEQPSAAESDSAEERSTNVFLDSVVVTAQKREQDINDVGIAVTAFNGEQLEAARFENVADVFAQVPGAQARRHVPSRGVTTNLFIRGVGQTDFNDGTESSVAPFLDDFYLISASTTDSSTFDVERVEVLRGPQGTVFGRNTTGGAVQTVTNKPTDELEGGIQAGIGNFGKVEVDGFINIPLNDTFQLRLSGVRDLHDPYVKNVFPGANDILDQDFSAYRTQLRILPTDALSINIKYEYANAQGALNADQGFNVAGLPDGDIVEIPVGVTGFDPVALGVDGPDITSQDNLNDAFNTIHHGLIRAEWDLGNSTLTSISGFLDQRYSIFEDCDGRPAPDCSFSNALDSHHWSQELRLNGEAGRLTYTAGLYYLGQDASNNVALGLGITPASMTTSGLPESAFIDVNWDLNVRSFAAYGQLEYALTDQLTLILGGRVNNDRKEFEQVRDFVVSTLPAGRTTYAEREDYRAFLTGEIPGSRANGFTFTEAAVGDLTVQDDTNFSGTLQLDYRPNDDLLVYASARRGLKAAGFNNGLTNVPGGDIALLAFDQEVLHAFETGWKWSYDWGNVYGQLNGAIYYYLYDDYQATAYVGVGNVISNNDATSKGFELEYTVVPADGWFVSVGGSYFDGNVEDVTRVGYSAPTVVDATAVFVSDRDFGEAPEFTVNALARYEWQSLGADWAAQLDYNFIDAREGDVLNQAATKLKEMHLVNGSVSVELGNGFTASIWARNIGNYRVPQFRLVVPEFASIGQNNWNEPRTYGFSVGYDF